MTSRFKDSSLILAIIFCGTLIGAFTYSRLALYRVGVSPMGPMALVASGADGLKEEIFWMFMHPIVVLTLYVTLIMNWKDDSRRPLILISILVYCLALSATRLFYGRELVAFVNGPLAKINATRWLASALQWRQLSWIRVALMYIAEISLLIAFMRSRPVGAQQPALDLLRGAEPLGLPGAK